MSSVDSAASLSPSTAASHTVHTVPVTVFNVNTGDTWDHSNDSSFEVSCDPSTPSSPPSLTVPPTYDPTNPFPSAPGIRRSGPLPGGFMEPVKFASINVNGLKAAGKRRSIFGRLRDSGFDVCLLQETHSSTKEEHIWRSEWGGQAIFCHGSTNSRGVMILLKRDLSYKINTISKDDKGRILLMDIEIGDQNYTVGTLYAPTADGPEEQLTFMDDLEDRISGLNPINVIIGGDLNVALDPAMDRKASASPHSYGDPMRQRINTLMGDLDLRDAWRFRNQSERRFTFH